MATLSIAINSDVMLCSEPEASVSGFERPFKLLVKDRTFILDPQSLSKLSPIFAIMLFSKDYKNRREVIREIVDEKSGDI